MEILLILLQIIGAVLSIIVPLLQYRMMVKAQQEQARIQRCRRKKNKK